MIQCGKVLGFYGEVRRLKEILSLEFCENLEISVEILCLTGDLLLNSHVFFSAFMVVFANDFLLVTYFMKIRRNHL